MADLDAGTRPVGIVARPSFARALATTRPVTAVAAIAYVLLVTFPIPRPLNHWANAVGLDASWRWALNRLATSDFRFGDDVVFTFGPLGYLLVPIEEGSAVVQAMAFWLVTHVVFAGALVLHYRRHRRALPVLCFALAYALALSLHTLVDYHLLVVLALLLAFAPEDGWAWRVAAPIGGVLAAAMLFLKFPTGIAAFSMIAIASASWLIGRNVRPRTVVVRCTGVYVATGALLAWLTIGSPGGFIRWVSTSLDASRGYGAGMSAPGPTLPIVLGLVGLSTFVLVLIAYARIDGRMLTTALLFAGPLYVAFRHAYIRHQGLYFLPVLLGLLGVLMITASSLRRLLPSVVVSVVVFWIGFASTPHFECACGWRPQELAAATGRENIGILFRLDKARSGARAESEARLAPDLLPEKWVERIRASGGNLDVLPFETNVIAANRLPWHPNPVIQLYFAYTERLDAWVARHFSSADAPQWLVVAWADIDARHPLWSQPRTWRTLLARYRLDLVDEQRWMVLLERRPEGPPPSLGSVGTSRHRAEEWMPVPVSEELLFAGLDLRTNLFGRLASMVWRTPPIFLDYEFEDGTLGRNRILPGTVGGGILLSRVPVDFPEFVRLLSGEPGRGVTRFRLAGPGLGHYDDAVVVRWLETSTAEVFGSAGSMIDSALPE